MAAEGYLEVMFRAGWRVRPLDFAPLDELYDVRIVLELAAIERLCELPERPAMEELKRVWLVPVAGRETDGLQVAQLDEAFHQGLLAATGSREMTRLHHDVTERIHIVRRAAAAIRKFERLAGGVCWSLRRLPGLLGAAMAVQCASTR